jgi:Mn2+/Fe2+ NRAMP family transporter
MVGVSAALANGCGLAIETLTAGRVPKSWGAVAHVLFAATVVRAGGLAGFTKWMKALIVVMFFTIVICALSTFPEPRSVFRGIVPTMPKGTAPYVLSLIGGIGGSVTLLAYNYVPMPKEQTAKLSRMRLDIIVAYTFTALFGVSIALIATRVFYMTSTPITDADAVSKMAALLGSVIGSAGFYTYLAGFWAAVTASLLAVWQTIPLLAAECYALLRRTSSEEHLHIVSPRSAPSAFGVGLLTLSGALFAFAPRPLTIIVAYTIVGSLFVPFVAAVLLHLNTRVAWSAAAIRNSSIVNVLLALVLLLFLLIAGRELLEQLAALR